MQKRSKLRHRVVEFADYEGKIIRVVTNHATTSLLKPLRLCTKHVSVELFFRWIKQNLNVSRLFGTTKNAVFNQLFVALISYVILNFFIAGLKNVKPQGVSLISFTRRLFAGTFSPEW